MQSPGGGLTIESSVQHWPQKTTGNGNDNGNGNDSCGAGMLSVVGRGLFVAVTVNVAVTGSYGVVRGTEFNCSPTSGEVYLGSSGASGCELGFEAGHGRQVGLACFAAGLGPRKQRR